MMLMIDECRLAAWVICLHATVMATVVMCLIQNRACTATSILGKEYHVNCYKKRF